jgi:hypothetical protein
VLGRSRRKRQALAMRQALKFDLDHCTLSRSSLNGRAQVQASLASKGIVQLALQPGG